MFLTDSLNPRMPIISQVIFIFFVLVIPVLLLVFLLLYLRKAKKLRLDLEAQIHHLKERCPAAEKPSLDQAAGLKSALLEINPELAKLFDELLNESQLFYAGRFLPDTARKISKERLVPKDLQHFLSLRSSVLMAAIGSVSSAIVYLYIKVTGYGAFPSLALLPLIAGLATAFYLGSSAFDLRKNLDELYAELRDEISLRVPVYNEESAAALLTQSFTERTGEMETQFQAFHDLVERLIRQDFSVGICQAVKDVMLREVAPPIRQSAQNLSDLAQHLDQRQQKDMERLAVIFSQQVSQSLSRELRPLVEELRGLHSLMRSVNAFVNESTAVLKGGREQNLSMHRMLSEALNELQKTQEALAREVELITSNLDLLSKVSKDLSDSCTRSENTLTEDIEKLSGIFDHALDTLSKSLSNCGNALQEAGKIRQDMDLQSRGAMTQLGKLSAQLEDISRRLLKASESFTEESDAYVQNTLHNFDQALSEVVERLSFSASAIRDAVESLPQALRSVSGKDNG